ncbi:amidase [Brachybacterium tyrofermentans]|uniref:Amidase n=1 Tax=Brachybacterium tyrofermentans TaxID=47848 RepID=A0ABW0FIA1_9MICO
MPERPTLSLTEARAALDRQETTSRDLTDECLARIHELDEDLRAFITVDADGARQRADRADEQLRRGERQGPLHGLPLAVKDNLAVAGQITTMGSAIFRDHVPTQSADVVERLTEQGAVNVGKTALHEFALGVTTENPHYGICRNPVDRERTPGGSSGGSAVAVTTGMALGAIGSDTSGSIRIPAAACGIVGLKPTYGRVSTHGCYPESWSLDHVGVLAQTVQDAAVMLDAISGHDPRVPGSLDLPPTTTARDLPDEQDPQQALPLRIGIEESFFFHDVDPEIETEVRSTLDALVADGAQLVPLTLPSLGASIFALTVIDTAETTAVHDEQFRRRPQDYGEDVRLLLECGAIPSAVDYVQSQQIRAQVRREFQEAFAGVDVIVAPTLPIQTPRIGEATVHLNGREADRDQELMRLVGPANLVGLPSISVPCGQAHGMPVGLQVIGPALGELAVLRAAARVEGLVGERLPAQRRPLPHITADDV